MFDITYYYDLHIHSVLSPDGDELMTPNNILNMAMLKQLDFIAITDHNSAKQLPTIQAIETAYDFIVIPGIEVTVAEGFDVLCYFKTYQQAYHFDAHLEPFLNTNDWGPYTKNHQVISDIYDQPKQTVDIALRSTTMPYDTLVQLVREQDGLIVLAHIARHSKSAILHYSLDELDFDGVEVQPYIKEDFLMHHPEVKQYPVLSSSDAHSLMRMHERTEGINLSEHSIDAFFEYVKGWGSHE